MEVVTLAAAAVTYLVASIKKSKGFEKASEEMSLGLWNWVRPLFIKDDTPLIDLKDDPDNDTNQKEVELKITKYIQKNEENKNSLLVILENLKQQGIDVGSTTNIISQYHYGEGDIIGRDKYGK